MCIGKKKGKRGMHLLKNRLTAGVLLAILVQSIVFGIVLLSTGLFTSMAQEPDRIMISRLSEREKLISSRMNDMLMEGMNLKKQITRETTEDERNTMLIEALNRVNYISGIFYVSALDRSGAYFKDSEPKQYNIKGSDITCAFGRVPEGKAIPLAQNWKCNMSERSQAVVQKYIVSVKGEDGWVIEENGSIYYIITQEIGNDVCLLGLQIDEHVIEDWLREEDGLYEGIHFILIHESSQRFWRKDGSEIVISDEQQDGYESISWRDDEGIDYSGFQIPLQAYGRFPNNEAIYLAVLCRESALNAMMWRAVRLVLLAYLVSIFISISVSALAVRMVLEPLKKLHARIGQQRAGRVHFEESGIEEIDNISQALNVMTRELEESYSRYAFTMQEVEERVGSFECVHGAAVIYVTDSLKKMLDIPEKMFVDAKGIRREFWEELQKRLQPVEGMDAYTYVARDGTLRCVAFKLKEEEEGVFGVVTDKTAEYQQIEQFRFASEHDYLTGLSNAAFLKSRGEELLKEHRGTVNALAFCDLDNLKYVNDTYGHNVGDRYIMAMAKKLEKMEQKGDCLAARISGDEFAVLMTGYESREALLEDVMEMHRMRIFIALPEGGEYEVKASVGVAYQESMEDGVELLTTKADKAMYQIKHGAKNGVGVYDRWTD